MTTTNCTILIVEDDKDIRESMKDALEIEGYDVITAANGKEGLTVLKTISKTCLILLDLIMPNMSGREFLDTVKADSALSPIPIFVISGVATKDNTEGTIGWLKKPADLETILTVVKDHCAHS